MNLNNPVSTTQIGWGLAHRFHNDDAAIPFYINDDTITEWNGKHIPMMIDPTANHTVKTAADGAALAGYLVMAEDRKIEGFKIGTVQMHGATNLPIKDADALAPGDLVVGAGGGEVRKALEADGVAGVGRICTAVYTADGGKKYADVVFS